MVAHLHAGAEEVPHWRGAGSRWLRETKEECAGKDVFLLEIAKGRALDGSAPFDSEGGYVVVKLEFIFFSVNKSYLSVEYLLHILDGHNYP